MSLIPNEWFVRESVTNLMNEKVLDIASDILDNYVEEFFSDDDDEVAEVLAAACVRHVDVSDMTHEEMEYMLKYARTYCALGHAMRCGVLVQDDNGNIMLPKHIEDNL